MRQIIMAVLFLLVAPLASLDAQEAETEARNRVKLPKADVQDAHYGPHERNVLDLWKAPSMQPTPLVIYLHGGGFYAGNKENLKLELLNGLLKSGISVASSNYRLSQQAPFPAPFHDCARAVQYLRSRASEWNLDPGRIAGSGYSAGAGVAVWLGVHDDLANPRSEDPILRQSTRLSCVAVHGGPASFDPRWIRQNIGGTIADHPAVQQLFGLKEDERETPRARELYDEASAIRFVSPNDPPMLLYYGEPKPNPGIHSHNYGLALKEKLAPLKIECDVKYHHGDHKAMYADWVQFFAKHLAAAGPPPASSSGASTGK